MGLPVEKHRYTVAEYLALEEKAEQRNEFHEGEILAMSGGTYQHSRISMNAGTALDARLKGKPCQPLDSQMRVRITGLSKYVYPDISVVCGELEFDSEDPRHTIINPRLIIEVLSESTEAYHRGEKFELYQRIPSFVEYVLISQLTPLIASFLRQEDGSWRYGVVRGLQSSVEFSSIGVSIPLTEIYDRLNFMENSEA